MKYKPDDLCKLLEYQYIFLIICNKIGTIEYISSEGISFFDLARDAAIGLKVSELSPKNISRAIWDIVVQAFDSGDMVNKEIPVSIDGAEKWIDVSAFYIHKGLDDDLVLLSARDITVCRIAEDKFAQSEIRINKLLGGSPVPIFVLNPNHEVIYWNRAAQNYTGISSSDMIGTDHHYMAFYSTQRPCLVDLLLDNSVEDIEKWYGGKYRESSAIAGAYEAEDFFPNIGPDGKWLHFTAYVVRDEDGSVIGAIETLEDITELRNISKALLEKEKIFRLLFKTMSEGVAIHDLVYKDSIPVDYKITEINEAYNRILGISEDEAVGSLASELYGVSSPPYLEKYSLVALSGNPENFEVYYAPMDKYFQISVVSPKKGSFATIFSDITDRKRSEILLRDNEKKFREVFNNANDIVLLVEMKEYGLGKIKAINSQGLYSLGYEEKELVGMAPHFLIDNEDRQMMAEYVEKISDVKEVSFEIDLKRKDGSKIPVEVKSRLFDLEGKPVIISIMRDITEKKMAREIEKKAFFQIEANIRQLATLGDSIRNPLTVIVGLADLHGGELGDKIKKEAAEIDDYITMLDRGWIESEKVRDFLKRHYNIK